MSPEIHITNNNFAIPNTYASQFNLLAKMINKVGQSIETVGEASNQIFSSNDRQSGQTAQNNSSSEI